MIAPDGALLAVDAPATVALPLVLTGGSVAVARLRADIEASRRSGCVLIEAEPGLDCRDVAGEVRRGAGGPFLTLACGAAEPAEVERALFGDERRGVSVSESESVAPGSAVAQARGGTLFLEDVTDLSATAQARLARLVRDGEAIVGGVSVPLHLTLLAAAVPESVEGGLRRELRKHFERRRIPVPPLRRRAEDIPVLVEQLLAGAARRAGVPPLPLTHPAMTVLAALPWRGNLVELRQAVARLTVTAATGVIRLEDVLTHVRFDAAVAPVPAGTLRSARQQFERDYIALVIRHHRGHIGAAAQALGIQRTNLYRKARQLGLAVRGRR